MTPRSRLATELPFVSPAESALRLDVQSRRYRLAPQRDRSRGLRQSRSGALCRYPIFTWRTSGGPPSVTFPIQSNSLACSIPSLVIRWLKSPQANHDLTRGCDTRSSGELNCREVRRLINHDLKAMLNDNSGQPILNRRTSNRSLREADECFEASIELARRVRLRRCAAAARQRGRRIQPRGPHSLATESSIQAGIVITCVRGDRTIARRGRPCLQ